PPAVGRRDVVPPAEGRRRIRRAPGGREPDLPAALRPEGPGALLRGGVPATVRRGAARAAAAPGPSGAGGLRVRTPGGLPPAPDVRAVARRAPGPGQGAAPPEGL